ncbi:MAG: hypothetical protein QM731_23865 [Chitinophagaceae bacterium]
MRFLPVTAVIATTLLAGVVTHAQTADDVINKYFDAIGGKDKISSIKSIYVEADIEAMGNAGSSKTSIVAGKALRSDIDFGGQTIVQVLTADKGGWSINPFVGQTSATAMPDEQVKQSTDQLDIGGPLLNYAAKGNKVELAGTEAVNNVTATKLKLTTKGGAEYLFYFDPATNYLVKTVVKSTVNGQANETISVFTNYKKTDFGYVVAGNTELTVGGGFVLNMTNKKTEINKEIDSKIFDMPK